MGKEETRPMVILLRVGAVVTFLGFAGLMVTGVRNGGAFLFLCIGLSLLLYAKLELHRGQSRKRH